MKKIILAVLFLVFVQNMFAQQEEECSYLLLGNVSLVATQVRISGHVESLARDVKFEYIDGKYKLLSYDGILKFYYMPYVHEYASWTERLDIYKIGVDGMILDGAKESLWELKYEDKIIKQETFHSNVRHGIYKVLNFSGKIVFETYFENGEGVYQDHHIDEDRNVRVKGYMKDDKKEDCWFYYAKDGTLERHERYKDGLLHGDYLVFNEAGDTIYRSTFVNGTGNCKEFDFETGEVVAEGRYEQGKKVGYWKELNSYMEQHSQDVMTEIATRHYTVNFGRGLKSIYSVFIDGREYNIYAQIMEAE